MVISKYQVTNSQSAKLKIQILFSIKPSKKRALLSGLLIFSGDVSAYASYVPNNHSQVSSHYIRHNSLSQLPRGLRCAGSHQNRLSDGTYD